MPFFRLAALPRPNVPTEVAQDVRVAIDLAWALVVFVVGQLATATQPHAAACHCQW